MRNALTTGCSRGLCLPHSGVKVTRIAMPSVSLRWLRRTAQMGKDVPRSCHVATFSLRCHNFTGREHVTLVTRLVRLEKSKRFRGSR
jgi:hypothetical protein